MLTDFAGAGGQQTSTTQRAFAKEPTTLRLFDYCSTALSPPRVAHPAPSQLVQPRDQRHGARILLHMGVDARRVLIGMAEKCACHRERFTR